MNSEDGHDVPHSDISPTYQEIVGALYRRLDNLKSPAQWETLQAAYALILGVLQECGLFHYGMDFCALLAMNEIKQAVNERISPDDMVSAIKGNWSPIKLLDHCIAMHLIEVGNAYLMERTP